MSGDAIGGGSMEVDGTRSLTREGTDRTLEMRRRLRRADRIANRARTAVAVAVSIAVVAVRSLNPGGSWWLELLTGGLIGVITFIAVEPVIDAVRRPIAVQYLASFFAARDGPLTFEVRGVRTTTFGRRAVRLGSVAAVGALALAIAGRLSPGVVVLTIGVLVFVTYGARTRPDPWGILSVGRFTHVLVDRTGIRWMGKDQPSVRLDWNSVRSIRGRRGWTRIVTTAGPMDVDDDYLEPHANCQFDLTIVAEAARPWLFTRRRRLTLDGIETRLTRS